MQPDNHWSIAAGALLIGLILGAAGGYYYATAYVQKPAAQSAPQSDATTANSYTNVQTNPYKNVKVNPFQ